MEPVFILVYYMGMTYRDAYNLPIWKRSWYLKRLIDEISKSNGQSKSTSAQARALGNKTRPDGPHRTRRFT